VSKGKKSGQDKLPKAKKSARKAGKAAAAASSLLTLPPLAHYEGAKPSRLRKLHREGGSPNSLVEQGAVVLRAQARFLERNHDLSRGIIVPWSIT